MCHQDSEAAVLTGALRRENAVRTLGRLGLGRCQVDWPSLGQGVPCLASRVAPRANERCKVCTGYGQRKPGSYRDVRSAFLVFAVIVVRVNHAL